MRTLPVAVLVLAVSWACGSSPSAPLPRVPPTPPAPLPLTQYRVSGVVTDENGSPVANAQVEVTYYTSRSATRANDGGSYALDFTPATLGFAGAPSAIGALSASASGYWPDVQVPAASGADVVQNMRLRRVRSIGAGSSILISLEPDSSLVGEVDGDFGTYWDVRNARERFVIDSSKSGTIRVRADDGDDGSGYPFLEACRSTPHGCIWEGSGQGDMTFRAQAGGRYEIAVRAPSRTEPRRYMVSTALSQ